MKTTKMMMIAVMAMMVFFSACSNDVIGPDADSAVSRSPYWTLKSWENVKLTWASLMWSETTDSFKVQVRGSVLVRNLAYHKQVVIRYTTDGWKTWKEAYGRYSQTSTFNPYGDSTYSAEFWNFEAPTMVFPKAYAGQSIIDAVNLNFEFAIEYRVNGTSYWDNNGGNNYRITEDVRYISN